MSDKQSSMNFECLPNEIFMDCFEYLNASDIFFAFEQSNHRFYQLVRTIRLSLNFQDIHKSVFDRFCQKMLVDAAFQQQIHSLQLSNTDTHDLIDVKKDNLEKLSLMLPLLSELICVRLIDCSSITDKLISKLSKSKQNILSTSSFGSTLSSFREIIPLKKLSVDFLRFYQLHQMLQHMPLLQYLNASRINQYGALSAAEIRLLDGLLNHLKDLIVTDFSIQLSVQYILSATCM